MPNVLTGEWLATELDEINTWYSRIGRGNLEGSGCKFCQSGLIHILSRPTAKPQHGTLGLSVGVERVSCVTTICDVCGHLDIFDATLSGAL